MLAHAAVPLYTQQEMVIASPLPERTEPASRAQKAGVEKVIHQRREPVHSRRPLQHGGSQAAANEVTAGEHRAVRAARRHACRLGCKPGEQRKVRGEQNIRIPLCTQVRVVVVGLPIPPLRSHQRGAASRDDHACDRAEGNKKG